MLRSKADNASLTFDMSKSLPFLSQVEKRFSYAIKYPKFSLTWVAYLASSSFTFSISASVNYSFLNKATSFSDKYL